MRTILGRLTQIKTGVSDLSDEELQDLDFNNVDKALKSVGISLKDSTGQIRDADEVLFEVAKNWNTLDSNTQHYLATQMAGTQQQSRFTALMNGYNRTIELQSIAYNSAGKASENFAKVQDTLSYSVNQAKNNLEQLKTSFIKSSTLKGLVDTFNKLLSGATDIGGSGSLAALGSDIVAVYTAIQKINTSYFDKGASNLVSAGQSIYEQIHKGAVELANSVRGAFSNSKGSTSTKGSASTTTSAAGENVSKGKGTLRKIVNNPKVGAAFFTASTVATAATQKATMESGSKAATGITSVGNLLGSALSLIPGWGAIAGSAVQLASDGIALVVNQFEKHEKILKNRKERLKKANANINSYLETTQQDIQDSVKKVSSAKSNYDIFKSKSERYQQLQAQGFLSSSEQEEMATLFTELKDNYADYVKVVDEDKSQLQLNANALSDLKKSTDEVIEQNQRDIKRDIVGQVRAYDNRLSTDKSLAKQFQKDIYDTAIDGVVGKGFTNTSVFQETLQSLSDDVQETLFKELLPLLPELNDDFSNLNEILSKTPEAVYEVSDALTSVLSKVSTKKDEAEAIRKGTEEYLQALGLKNLSPEMAKAISYGGGATKKQLTENFTVDDFFNNYLTYFQGNEKAASAFSKLGVTKLDDLKDLSAENIQSAIGNDEEYQALMTWLATGASKSVEELLDGLDKKGSENIWRKAIDASNDYINFDVIDALYGKIAEDLESTSKFAKEKAQKGNDLLGQIENSGKYTVSEIGNLWEELYNLYGNRMGIDVDAIKEQYTRDTVEKQQELSNIFNKNADYFKDYTQAEINEIYSIFETKIGSVSASQQGAIVKAIEDATKGITDEQREGLLSIFSDIDLTKGYSALEKQVNTWAQSLQEYGWDYTNACEVLESYILKGTTALMKGFKNVSDLKVNIENSISAVESIVSDSKDITAAIQSYNKAETITSENLGELLKAGLGSAYTTDKSGKATIDTKRIQSAFVNRVSQQYAGLYAQSLTTQGTLDVLKSYSNKSLSQSQISAIQKALNAENPQDAVSRLSSDTKGLAKAFLDSGADTSLLSSTTYKKIISDAVKASTDTLDEWQAEQPALKDYYSKAMMEALTGYSSKEDLEKGIKDLQKGIKDAEKSVRDAKKSLDDAQKAYEEALYGSKYRDNPLGDSYEYDLKIQRSTDKVSEFTTKIGNATDSLGNFINKTDALNNWANYIKAQQESVDLYSAKSQVLDIRKADIQSTLQNKIGNLLSYDENGNMWIDDKALTQLKTNDAWVNTYADLYKEYQEIIDTQKDYTNKIEEVNQAIIEQKKTALNNYLSAAQSVGEIFKQQDDKQVEQTKEKYSALKEADNDYLSALEESINKQKSLRDKENQYESLATQEKKLALLQRDTSGANRIASAQLEKDIQDSRQDMLDTEISDMIDNLKNWYEKQQEQWDKETELLTEISDNTNYTKIGQDWLSSAQSNPDEAIVNLQSMAEGYENMTVEQLQQLYNTYSEYIGQANNYSASLQAEAVTANAENIANIINTTGETLTTSVETKMLQTQETVDKAVRDATDALDDAKTALADAQTEYNDTLDKNGKLIKSLTELMDNWDTTLQGTHSTISKMIDELKAKDEELNGTTNPNYSTEDPFEGMSASERVQYIKSANGLDDKKKTKQSKNSRNSSTEIGIYDMSNLKQAQAALGSISSDWANTLETKDQQQYKVTIDKNAIQKEAMASRLGFSEQEVSDIITLAKDHYTFMNESDAKTLVNFFGSKAAKITKRYASGGLVNYTGPAWVDGSLNKPEAFLSSEDTLRIGRAAQILSDIPWFNPSSNTSSVGSQSFRDTSIEININIDSISNDYDVDKMMERMKNEITTAANYRGSNVILKK